MNFVRNPFWKLWRLPVEPGGNDSEGVAWLRLGMFKAKYKFLKESKRWILQRLKMEELASILHPISEKIQSFKVVLDSLKIVLYVFSVITALGSGLLITQQDYLIGTFLFAITILGVVFIRVIGIVFINMLSKLQAQFSSEMEGINTYLIEKQQKIHIGEYCFYIRFEIDDSKLLLTEPE